MIGMLYHATFQSHVPDILKHGLGTTRFQNWTDSIPGVVCLAEDPWVAISFCETCEAVSEEEIVCFGVEKEVVQDLLKPDPNIRSDEDSGCYIYPGVITPEHLIGPFTEEL